MLSERKPHEAKVKARVLFIIRSYHMFCLVVIKNRLWHVFKRVNDLVFVEHEARSGFGSRRHSYRGFRGGFKEIPMELERVLGVIVRHYPVRNALGTEMISLSWVGEFVPRSSHEMTGIHLLVCDDHLVGETVLRKI